MGNIKSIATLPDPTYDRLVVTNYDTKTAKKNARSIFLDYEPSLFYD